jgi:hypothetical protein
MTADAVADRAHDPHLHHAGKHHKRAGRVKSVKPRRSTSRIATVGVTNSTPGA